MSSRPVYRMCAQVAPSGECLRDYKPGAVVFSRLASAKPCVPGICCYYYCYYTVIMYSCLIGSQCSSTSCAVLRVPCTYVSSYVTSVWLSSWIKKGEYINYYYYHHHHHHRCHHYYLFFKLTWAQLLLRWPCNHVNNITGRMNLWWW